MFGEEKDQTKECKWKMFFSFEISKYLAMQTQITFFFYKSTKNSYAFLDNQLNPS